MNRTVLALTAVVSLALAPAPARATPGPRSTVLEAKVRFGRATDPAPLGKVSLRGDCLVGGSLTSLDPMAGGIRVALGPVVLLDGNAPPAGAKFRDRGSRGWALTVRRPFEGRGKLVLKVAPTSGLFDLRASGFPAGALRDAGPVGVVVEFRAGTDGGVDPVDFTAPSPRKWNYVRPVQTRPPPGGGGGGGGGGPPPTPGGLVTIAQGWSSAISVFRFEVVRDPTAWQALWTAHAVTGTPPPVDFATQMVVAVFLGDRMSGGYTATITQVTPSTVIGAPCTETWCPPTGAVATIIEDLPGWAPVTAAVTQPYHIVRVPRVEGPVLYEMMTRTQ